MAIHQVRAPLPGVFYRRPAPDEPPLKSEGERVAVGERIALVEAMKMPEGSNRSRGTRALRVG